MIEHIDFDEEELKAQRAEILARNGIKPGTEITLDCGCCPAVHIDWDDFHRIRTIDWLLGDD